MTTPNRALADLGVAAVKMLELGPADLEALDRLLHPAALAYAFAMLDHDVEFRRRWGEAGTDWTKRADALRAALFFVVTPDSAASRPCPITSAVTQQPCLLPYGHPQDSTYRFHRFDPRPGGGAG